MKPFYRSKKFWTAVFTVVGSGAAYALQRPALADAILSAGMSLVVGFGLADFGKEAKAIEK